MQFFKNVLTNRTLSYARFTAITLILSTVSIQCILVWVDPFTLVPLDRLPPLLVALMIAPIIVSGFIALHIEQLYKLAYKLTACEKTLTHYRLMLGFYETQPGVLVAYRAAWSRTPPDKFQQILEDPEAAKAARQESDEIDEVIVELAEGWVQASATVQAQVLQLLLDDGVIHDE